MKFLKNSGGWTKEPKSDGPVKQLMLQGEHEPLGATVSFSKQIPFRAKSPVQRVRSDQNPAYAPSTLRILPAIPSANRFIFSSDSASIITRASASVPE